MSWLYLSVIRVSTYNSNEVFRDDLVEAGQKILDLLLDGGVETILSR